MAYIGHINENGEKQLLKEHLLGTAKLCEKFACVFGAGGYGKSAGILHDVGKYSAAFQKRILANGPKVDHSTAGACLANNQVLQYCIAGHHAGLPDTGSRISVKGDGTLIGRLKKEEDLKGPLDYSNYKSEIIIPPTKLEQPKLVNIENDYYYVSFFIRMLYSCLVDADFLDTEAFMLEGEQHRGNFLDVVGLYNKYCRYIKKFSANNSRINKKRSEILGECLLKADNIPGIYTLTVPTGGGKTIASLGFALKHAAKYGKKRIIYVIPYTSIIEQTADVFREILGDENVVEHHANVDYAENEQEDFNRYKLATENWDATVIVTTNVQFFESIYANRSSRCRKLHNIVDSVIVFDEAQMLPSDFLRPCIRAITELVANYKVTAVLCTATQPSLNKFFPEKYKPKEICSDIEELYDFFKRVSYFNLGKISLEKLVNALNKEKQVLCITNSKKEAQEIFGLLECKNKYHLTTFMYPEHRRIVLKKIRECLKRGQPCQVVSTSLIEAGVDVDFPTVFREMAGIDNIIQAGGRCNREGKHTLDSSCVYVYSLDNTTVKIPSFIKKPIEDTKMVWQEYQDISLPEAIKKYFDYLHEVFKGQEALDKYGILDKSENPRNIPFKEIASEFKIIKSNTKLVLIPIEERAKQIEEELRKGKRTQNLLRGVTQYSVQLYEEQYDKMLALSKVEVLDENISVLLDLNAYDSDKGLLVDMNDGIGVFI